MTPLARAHHAVAAAAARQPQTARRRDLDLAGVHRHRG